MGFSAHFSPHKSDSGYLSLVKFPVLCIQGNNLVFCGFSIFGAHLALLFAKV